MVFLKKLIYIFLYIFYFWTFLFFQKCPISKTPMEDETRNIYNYSLIILLFIIFCLYFVIMFSKSYVITAREAGLRSFHITINAFIKHNYFIIYNILFVFCNYVLKILCYNRPRSGLKKFSYYHKCFHKT